MDGRAEYGSCLSNDIQSAPVLQSDYKEVRMPPREAEVPNLALSTKGEAKAPKRTSGVTYVSGMADAVDDRCRLCMAVSLSIASLVAAFSISILLATDTPEPGWMESVVAILFTVTTLWLYFSVKHQASIIKEVQAHHEELKRQVEGLSDVEAQLTKVAQDFQGDADAASEFLDELQRVVTSNTMVSFMNSLSTHYGQRIPQAIGGDDGFKPLERVFEPLFGQMELYEQNREKIQDWLYNDGSGREINDVYDFVRRVAEDDNQMEYPERPETEQSLEEVHPFAALV